LLPLSWPPHFCVFVLKLKDAAVVVEAAAAPAVEQVPVSREAVFRVLLNSEATFNPCGSSVTDWDSSRGGAASQAGLAATMVLQTMPMALGDKGRAGSASWAE
jgi:hypothetical protein